MFENPRRGSQARNFTKNVPKILDLKSNRYFPKIDVGCPWSREKTIFIVRFLGREQKGPSPLLPSPRGGGGAGTPLYKLYRYVLPHRVWFLRRFGLKTGKNFGHFGLVLGMVFEGITGVYERLYRFNSKWVSKKQKYANSFEEFLFR